MPCLFQFIYDLILQVRIYQPFSRCLEAYIKSVSKMVLLALEYEFIGIIFTLNSVMLYNRAFDSGSVYLL